LDWNTEWAAHYRKYSQVNGPGVIEWDGRLLDGWSAGDVIEFKQGEQAPPTAPD
jgi:hypothetical protein